MLSRSGVACCFARLAATSAAAFAARQKQRQRQHHEENGVHAANVPVTHGSGRTDAVVDDDDDDATVDGGGGGDDGVVALWIDDTAAAAQARAAHVRSAAYKELHRPAMTTSAMGLYGGEPGFEKAFRVWVDPDRPHMKHIFNQTALARNLRYARYGYFKRDMHILDVDKLVRHARMLPQPSRLLTDFLYQRVSLPDVSCAALLRYQREQLAMLDLAQRRTELRQAEEMFERMLVTNIPPVEVGVATHAEMVRCCAVCEEWQKGWHVYYVRAREMEAGCRDGSFVLNTDLFDAVLELCVACARPLPGMRVLRDVIARHLRPRSSMLNRVMTLASMAVEQLDSGSRAHDDHDGDDDDGDDSVEVKEQCADESTAALPADAAMWSTMHEDEQQQQQRRACVQRGLDTWALFDFYALPRDTQSIECYMRMCAMFGNTPTRVLEALGLADGAGIAVSLTCYCWALYAVRVVPDFGDYVMDVFAQLTSRGLTPDYVLFTMAFLYCAVHADGELALAVYTQFFVTSQVRPTPEMVLLVLQACARCARPRVAMLHCCEALLEQLERSGSAVDLLAQQYDQLLYLAAHVGAVAVAFSRLKKLASYGKPLTTRLLNALLLANARAAPPSGGVAMLHEIVQLFRVLQVPTNATTLACVQLCREAHGSDADVDAWCAALQQQNATVAGATAAVAAAATTMTADVDDEEAVPVQHTPPHRLRRLYVPWKLQARDMVLRRYGQASRGRPTQPAQSAIGSVVPFGRAPGEQAV